MNTRPEPLGTLDVLKNGTGQSRTPESLAAARRIIDRLTVDHVAEAAGNAEEVIRHLTATWQAEGFTPEQCVFALALVTINYRETIPDTLGGKAMFDRIAGEARIYYDANKDK